VSPNALRSIATTIVDPTSGRDRPKSLMRESIASPYVPLRASAIHASTTATRPHIRWKF
jgi:hypothetical protein